jgi:hypothetical protein
MPNEPSGQVAAPTQGTARVRFEFAGRAHRREFTPKLEIKRKENKVKEKEENFEKKEKRIHHRGHREERGSGREIPRVLLRVAVVVRDGRDFLVSDIAAIPPLHRKKSGSGVGMTNAEGRWMLAGFECVAFADGVGRGRYRSRQIQEKTRTP